MVFCDPRNQVRTSRPVSPLFCLQSEKKEELLSFKVPAVSNAVVCYTTTRRSVIFKCLSSTRGEDSHLCAHTQTHTHTNLTQLFSLPPILSIKTQSDTAFKNVAWSRTCTQKPSVMFVMVILGSLWKALYKKKLAIVFDYYRHPLGCSLKAFTGRCIIHLRAWI